MRRLAEHHIEDLKSSGLSDEIIHRSGFYSVSAEKASKTLSFTVPTSGLAIPYNLGNGKAYTRVKPDQPYQPPGWEKAAKYLSPRGSGNHLYIVPGTNDADLQNADLTILITEGEKKALKATQEGYLCVGLSGVWNWCGGKDQKTNQRHTIEDLDRIRWEGRRVFLVFDSDAAQKPNVMAAEQELARHLAKREADVRIVRLPECEDYAKTGLDDFFVVRGKKAFDELLEAAQSPVDLAPPTFTNTEDGNADRLVFWHGRDLRSCHENGWMVWNNTRWIEDRTDETRRRAVSTAKSIGQEAGKETDTEKAQDLLKWAASSLTHYRLKAMIASAQSKHPLPVVIEDLDTQHELLNLRNGTIDLKTDRFREHSRRDLITKLAPVAYDPDAECPTWLSFLNRILDGSKDVTF